MVASASSLSCANRYVGALVVASLMLCTIAASVTLFRFVQSRHPPLRQVLLPPHRPDRSDHPNTQQLLIPVSSPQTPQLPSPASPWPPRPAAPPPADRFVSPTSPNPPLGPPLAAASPSPSPPINRLVRVITEFHLPLNIPPTTVMTIPSTPPSPSPSPLPATDSMKRRPKLALPCVASLCNSTQYPHLCLQTLAAYRSKLIPAARLQDLTAYVAWVALKIVNLTYDVGVEMMEARGGGAQGNDGSGDVAVLQDCVELLDGTRDGLTESIRRLRWIGKGLDGRAFRAAVMDVRSWLSGAYTDQDTCWEEFGEEGEEEEEGSVAPGPAELGHGAVIERRLKKDGLRIAPLLSLALAFAQTLQDSGPSAYYTFHPCTISL